MTFVEENVQYQGTRCLNLSDCKVVRTHNFLVGQQTLNHLTKLVKWLSCDVSTDLSGHLTVCSYNVTDTFQSKSAQCNCLSVKLQTKWLWVQILLQSFNVQILCLFQTMRFLKFMQIHSKKHTFILSKWLSVQLRSKWLWISILFQLLKL